MSSSLLADLTVLVHFAFVVFVVLGGFLALRWPRLAWIHVPAAVWGALIEFAGWICPLTPLEIWLRRRAGEAVYEGGFVERYIMGLLYPEGLPRRVQILLGVGVIVINVIAYGLVAFRRRWADRTADRAEIHKGSGGTPTRNSSRGGGGTSR